MIETNCAGCDLPTHTNDMGLCRNCAAKLERDLIRNRDWDYSVTAFGIVPEKREALRERIIREYGSTYELILPPESPTKTTCKSKRSHSRATQHKKEIAANTQPVYTTEDVLQAAQKFLRNQPEEWVNFSSLAQHLYERFYKLNPKHLGKPGKKYESLLKLLLDYPSSFKIRQDADNRSLYWISLVAKAHQ